MAWNGTGTFARTQDFSADRDTGSPDHFIDADKMDDELDNLSTGIQACLPINGEQAITGNIDFGSNRAYNLAAPTAIADATNVAAVDIRHYAADTGAADAYVITPSPAIAAYATGQEFNFFATNASTGASTLNVNAKGAKAIQLNGAAIASGDIPANALVKVVYDGTQFQMLSPKDPAGGLENIVEDTTPQLGAALDGQGYDLNNLGVVFMTEQAAAEADVAGKGQLWVKTATPNQLWFTDDAGNDFRVVGGAHTLSSLFITEAAAAAADVAGDGQYWVKTATPNQPWFTDDSGQDFNLLAETFIVAMSDETTDLTTGDDKAEFEMPFDFYCEEIVIACNTPPVGATITVDVEEEGTTILSTLLTIDASEDTSSTAATPAVISDAALAAGSKITFNIDQVGSSTAGTGLKATMKGYRT
jgi:hypothetical protein